MSSKSYSSSVATDQRVQLETTEGGQFVGPGSTVANPGAISATASQYGQTQINAPTTYTLEGKFSQGLSGSDVQGILEQQAAIGQIQQENAQKMAELTITSLSAAKVGQSIDWKQYIPLGIVAVIAIALTSRRHT